MLIDRIVQFLRDGHIPENEACQECCACIAIVHTAYTLYARDHKETLLIQLIDHVHDEARSLVTIHPVWVKLSIRNIVDNMEVITANFDRVAVIKLTKALDLCIANVKYMQHRCQWCQEVFLSDVNRARCEASHVHAVKLTEVDTEDLTSKRAAKLCAKKEADTRKLLEERSTVSISDLTTYWDNLDIDGRKAIVKETAAFLAHVPTKAKLTVNAQRLVDAAAGKVDITGAQLMVSLDECSEYTFLYRMVRPMDKSVLSDVGDYIAAIANEVVIELALANANASAKELLEAETEGKKRAEEKNEKRRMQRLEKLVWRTPVSTFNWADDEY